MLKVKTYHGWSETLNIDLRLSVKIINRNLYYMNPDIEVSLSNPFQTNACFFTEIQ